jgi:hypothetical protein
MQRRHEFQNICLYETGKVAVSARILSSDVRWRRILHATVRETFKVEGNTLKKSTLIEAVSVGSRLVA